MIKKTFNYTDYDGNEREKEYWFNLSKAELVEMNFETEGGLQDRIQKIIDEEDTKKIIDMFKEIISKSVGIKSEDGNMFVKNEQIRNEFMQSEPYSDLFLELIQDSAKAADFINGIIPASLKQQIPQVEAPVNTNTQE